MRILVVEDDDRVARGLVRALLRAGYRVVRAADVAEAHALIAEQPPDLALVDMGLPDGHGSAVVRRLREHPATGVLVVTAQDGETERVVGLRAGADDYVVKPFSLAELLARIEAVSRRTRALRQSVSEPAVVHRRGSLELDVTARTLRDDDGWSVTLTAIESAVLALLLERTGQPVERRFVIDQVWAVPTESSSRTLDTHMATLRGKLEDRVVIRTLRGVGYQVDP
ncbi:response regulator transcription factor [Pseudonocardia nematodicida]|uniref:Response regulator transcription factor n=1 Tax=Pseudonocardia nematodicida TaxID=1206997 RepID=A0ABV1KD58_9PSEU